MNDTTLIYGGMEVVVHRRPWKSGPRVPYRKAYTLKPGQHWSEAEETPNQWEHYVLQEDGSQIPVGALIAREFVADGADLAFFTEMWGSLVFIGPDLVCFEPPVRVKDFIGTMKSALGGLKGLPDVIGFFPDARIRLHEAKNAGAKDKLQEGQHRFAQTARSIYGSKVEFGVTEWGHV